jgi:hypothetical protein
MTARRLSYLIGRADQTSLAVGKAIEDAREAEKNVTDVLRMVADQAGHKLPEQFNIQFKEEENEVTIVEKDLPMPIVQNGVHHE